MSENASASVPLEVLQKLASAAEQMGINLPGCVRFAPTIDVTQPIRTLALELGRLVAKENIFLKAGKLVTVAPETGEERAMTPARFCGWVEEFCAIKNPSEMRARQSLSRETASLVLEQDIFRDCIRPLTAVHLMRLPVRREDGKVEFLEKGYDTESQIFTAEVLPYPMDWTLDQAREFLLPQCSEYPWNVPEPREGEVPLRPEESRSMAVHIAGMVGTYCRSLFPPGTPRPMISYIANQPGTGKSTLAAMALAPVFGGAAATPVPKDDAEMNKTLDTAAQNLMPYLFFDDIGYGITSAPLNQFITSSQRQGRVMGGNKEIFTAPVLAQVIVTGNDINISDDLRRRSLIAELFLAGDVRGRQFKHTITTRYLSRPEIRGKFLAACCALVRHWAAAGDEYGLPLHPKPLESFEEWSSVIGGIVVMGGFSDPLAAPELTVGTAGDSSDDLRELLVRVASEAEADDTYTRKQLVEKAREWGLVEGVIGSKEDGDIDAKASKRFGRQLQRWRGRELVDSHGRRFRFGHKRQKNGMTYPLTFVVPVS